MGHLHRLLGCWVSAAVWSTLTPALIIVPIQTVSSKTIENEFQLSQSSSEAVVGSFCISPQKRGHLRFEITATVKETTGEEDSFDEEDYKLVLQLYRDENWTSYETAANCMEKSEYSIEHQEVATTTTLDTANSRNTTKFTQVSMTIPNTSQRRAHYYYVVVTACNLLDEFFMDHKKKLPIMQYTLELTNNGSHLSADEMHLNIMHMLTVFVSGALATLLALKVLIQFFESNKNHNTVHAAVLWVMAAAASDSLASLLAIIHLELYAHNGIGSPLLDSFSCHLEATCDSLVALLLLSIGAGWTLPSDVVKVSYHNPFLQKIFRGLRSPFCVFAEESFSLTTTLFGFIFLSHVLLAQWGLHYHNNDFDSYHDLENLPGKTLMYLRVLLGLSFWICCANTKLQCPQSLIGFYNQLALVGTLWFQSLPILTWYVNSYVPVHLRHRTIGVWGASLQMISIALLSWLVTAHSTKYHKLSHLSASSPQDSLTERLSCAGDGLRTWTMLGGKAKVRLD